MIGEDLKRITQHFVFNILLTKQKEILPAYISNHNSTCEKQIVPLIIPNEEKEGRYYLAVKKYLHCYEE